MLETETLRILEKSAMQPTPTWCYHPQTGSTLAINSYQSLKSFLLWTYGKINKTCSRVFLLS